MAEKLILQLVEDVELKRVKTLVSGKIPPDVLCRYLAQAIVFICSQSEVKQEEPRPKIYTPTLNIPIKLK